MKIVCISDLHGTLPDIPDCDLVLIGGDIAPDAPEGVNVVNFQIRFMDGPFQEWIGNLKKRNIGVVAIAGNHDFWAERAPGAVIKDNYQYLHDEYCEVRGLKIWGSPWTLPFRNWVLMKTEDELREIYRDVRADILLIHEPPKGVGDFFGNMRLGSMAVRELVERTSPKLIVFGHIHEGYGQYWMGDTLAINAAYMGSFSQWTNPIQIVEL